jgi:hypothetical protein
LNRALLDAFTDPRGTFADMLGARFDFSTGRLCRRFIGLTASHCNACDQTWPLTKLGALDQLVDDERDDSLKRSCRAIQALPSVLFQYFDHVRVGGIRRNDSQR